MLQSTAREHARTDCFKLLGQIHDLQFHAASECVCHQLRQVLGKFDHRQRSAALERGLADSNDFVAEVYLREARAVGKSRIFNDGELGRERETRNLAQRSKANRPMDWRFLLLYKVICFREELLAKALIPMVLSDSGKLTLLREVQSAKLELPIVWRFLLKLTRVSFQQPENVD